MHWNNFPLLMLWSIILQLNQIDGQNLLYLDLSGGWRFRTDPYDQGIVNHWFAPNHPDSSWATIPVPDFWEWHEPLVRRSFEYYWQRWLQPYQGAHLHQGKFWPYAFELSTCYLLLDQLQKAHTILHWHLQHQTFPGVYAWGEQLDTATARFAAGDIPHAWVAADFTNLVRTMLIYEKADTLVLGAGIPFEWLRSGNRVGIEHAPTYFGNVSYQVELDSSRKQLKWEINAENIRAASFILKMPDKIKTIRVWMDKRPWHLFNPEEVKIPAGSHRVILNLNY